MGAGGAGTIDIEAGGAGTIGVEADGKKLHNFSNPSLIALVIWWRFEVNFLTPLDAFAKVLSSHPEVFEQWVN